MANEKTEEATPKRKEEERKKGNISRSQDLQSALLLLLAFVLIFVLAKYMFHNLQVMSYWAFTNMHPDKIKPENIVGFLSPFAIYVVKIAIPFLLCYLISTVVVIRLPLSTAAVSVNPEKSVSSSGV